MAFLQYLVFDGVPLPLPDSYEIGLEDVEADSGGETEAGTRQRDVVRLGVVNISVSFSVSPRWLKLLTGFKQQERISVDYLDTETLEMRRTGMFMEGYKAGLVKDTSYKGLWKVSFTLREF
ncbi:hypothetical protein [[Clostridium] symbiosum]|uniref:hypothetical protein n=1 Tax=Clostridium symbiosum TaxID=1512 RepID=UPI00189F9EF3|nr:hypothetical protein [[Clostridium] symbiosum]